MYNGLLPSHEIEIIQDKELNDCNIKKIEDFKIFFSEMAKIAMLSKNNGVVAHMVDIHDELSLSFCIQNKHLNISVYNCDTHELENKIKLSDLEKITSKKYEFIRKRIENLSETKSKKNNYDTNLSRAWGKELVLRKRDEIINKYPEVRLAKTTADIDTAQKIFEKSLQEITESQQTEKAMLVISAINQNPNLSEEYKKNIKDEISNKIIKQLKEKQKQDHLYNNNER